MNPFLTIILPVYNVEPYLRKCLNSLINQTFKNIEIICVNDGSQDGSLLILQEYASKDVRIKLVNQTNQGVAIARNIGIELASGKYLMFVDSDDYIDLETCQKLYNFCQNSDSDVISYNFYSVTKNVLRKINIPYNHDTEYKIQEWGHVNRIYKKDFINNNHIRYPQNIKVGEDVVFISLVILSKPSYSYIDICPYYYISDRNGSATKNYSNNLQEHIRSYQYLKNTEAYQEASPDFKLYITDLWGRSIFNLWSNLPIKYIFILEINREMHQFIDEFKQYKNFNYKQKKGYIRIKYRYLYKILKILRNLIFLIIYRNK